MKTYYRFEEAPSAKRVLVVTLLYAAFPTMMVSRRLLALVRRRLATLADRIQAQRRAAVLLVARDVLAAVLRPPRTVKVSLAKVQRVLLHGAVAPDAASSPR